MQLDRNKIRERNFSLSRFTTKFRICKTKKGVKEALQELGGTILERGSLCLIGKETDRFFSRYTNCDYIFEGELEDRDYQSKFKYFKDYDLRFYDMIRELLSTSNIDFTYFEIGTPVSKEDFVKYEKKLKSQIPKAVKEFYSIFGEVRILWKRTKPYLKTSRTASKKVWNMDVYDNHIGSLQILPLKTVLFENWNDVKYGFGVGEDLKIFDTSTESNIVALEIKGDENPLVYLGEDHGVNFKDSSPMLFTDYFDLCIGLYGLRERMRYFQSKFAINKPKKEVDKAILGKLYVDINNDEFIAPQINALTPIIDDCIAKKDYGKAKEQVLKLCRIEHMLGIKYLLDLDRLQFAEKSFTRRMKQAVLQSDFNINEYEKENSGDVIFKSKLYLKLKDELLNGK